MSIKTIDLGPITAYADAVAGGYDGTREEWKVYIANVAENARQAAAAATYARGIKNVSEGWAVGTQNEIPVTEGSPYYHNNSKYYYEQLRDHLPNLEAVGNSITAVRNVSDNIEMLQNVHQHVRQIDHVDADLPKIVTVADNMTAVSAAAALINDFTDTIAKEYDNTKDYNVGDYILHNTDFYICNTAITAGEEFDINKWTKTDVADSLVDIASRLDDLEYSPVNISAFTVNPATIEIGSTQTTAALSWTMNRNASVLKIDGANVSVASRSQNQTGLNIHPTTTGAAKTWTIYSKDNRNHESTRTATMYSYNRVFYGVSSIGQLNLVDSAFVNGLANKPLSDTRARTITLEAGAGLYGYYCVPTRLVRDRDCIIKFNGNTVEFYKTTVNVTNASEYEESYTVYRSPNLLYGSTELVIS